MKWQAGYNTGTVAVLGASMKGFGIAEEVAATSIKNMMLALVAGDTATKGQKEAWEKLRLNHEKVAKDMQVNAEETTLSVLKSIPKLDKHEQASTLKELFGSESLLGIAPLLANLSLIEERLVGIKQASNFDGSMNKEYEARAATTANNIQLLKNNMAHLGITVGSVVLPALNELMSNIKPVIDKVVSFVKANPTLISSLFKVAAALFAFKAGSLATRFAFNLLFGGLLSGYGILLRTTGAFRLVSASIRLFKMGRAVSALRLFGLSARQARIAISLFSGGFNLVKSAIGGLGSAIAMIGRVIITLGRAMLTNPIILIGMAIAGVAYLIYKNWDTIKPMLMEFWQDITQYASNAWQWIVGVWSGFSAWFGGLWQGVVSWVKNTWASITQGASLAWGFLVGLWGGITSWFGGLWQSLLGITVGVWSGIVGFIGGVWVTIRGLVSAGVQGLMAIIRGFSPVSAFSAAFSAIWGFLSGLVGRFRSFGVNIIQGLIGGIKSMAGAVVSAISGVVGGVAGTAKRMLGINSPSRVFRQFGSWVSEGLSIGINKESHKPINAVGQLATGVTANFGTKMGNLSAQISTSVAEHQARMTNTNTANANNLNNQQQGNITIHFNPTINANGGDMSKIERALHLSQTEFEKMFNRMQADKLRRAY